MNYSSIRLSAVDIESQNYKEHLGGGAEHWEKRGAFQLYFLQRMGLKIVDRILDVGCGPARSGVHFINYLKPNKYCGIDSNPDFIQVATETVARDFQLSIKSPQLMHIEKFDFTVLSGPFTFVLAFSVLNHCAPKMRQFFLKRIESITNASSKIYVSHASWFHIKHLTQSQLCIVRSYNAAHEIAPDLNLQDWGWPPTETIFPILELTTRELN